MQNSNVNKTMDNIASNMPCLASIHFRDNLDAAQVAELSQQRLNELADCSCCAVHSNINKPTRWGPWQETSFPGPREWSMKAPTPNTCLCSCRHEARFLCRQHPLYQRPPLPYSTSELSSNTIKTNSNLVTELRNQLSNVEAELTTEKYNHAVSNIQRMGGDRGW